MAGKNGELWDELGTYWVDIDCYRYRNLMCKYEKVKCVVG